MTASPRRARQEKIEDLKDGIAITNARQHRPLRPPIINYPEDRGVHAIKKTPRGRRTIEIRDV